MIQFDYVYYRNFLSTGQQGTKILLDKSSTTMIVGENGSGKSTFCDAITFALFGKSYRGIPKGNLINSINERDMLQEVGFKVGQDYYVVRRGQKPSRFEIERNGKLLDQDAAVRDQQKFLETQIIKTSFKAFCQVTILGSAAYVPFMQLSSSERRRVIEQLLDIGVFSSMYKVLRGKISSWKDRANKVESDIQMTNQKIKMQMEFLKKLQTKSKDGITKQQQELSLIKESLIRKKDQWNSLKGDIAQLELKISALEERALHEIEQEYTLKQKEQSKLQSEISRLKKDKEFFKGNNNCKSCLQEIPDHHQKTQIEQFEDAEKKIELTLSKLKDESSMLSDTIEKIKGLMDEKKSMLGQQSILQASIETQVSQAKKIKKELESLSKEDGAALQKEKDSLIGYKQKLEQLYEEKTNLLSEKESLDLQARMLKDDGVKSKIIRQYIPVINKQVNKYLTATNFFVKFQIDENFNETLKSRHRDEFVYCNFSMGERQRIDLALLFAWREVARMKNSVNCNILIFDEIFDSSLDTKGTEDLLSILSTLDQKTRVFVISHKNLMEDKFRSVIHFQKVKDFSRITTGVTNG